MQTLVLLAGVTGTGKSTLASALGSELGWPVLDKDTSKSALLVGGLGEEAAAPLAYDLMFAFAGDLLAQGMSVILDGPATFALSVENATTLAVGASARLKTVLCTADIAVREARLMTRAGMPSQPNAPDEPPLDEAQRFAHLPPDTLTVDTDQPWAEVFAKALRYVSG